MQRILRFCLKSHQVENKTEHRKIDWVEHQTPEETACRCSSKPPYRLSFAVGKRRVNKALFCLHNMWTDSTLFCEAEERCAAPMFKAAERQENRKALFFPFPTAFYLTEKEKSKSISYASLLISTGRWGSGGQRYLLFCTNCHVFY